MRDIRELRSLVLKFRIKQFLRVYINELLGFLIILTAGVILLGSVALLPDIPLLLLRITAAFLILGPLFFSLRRLVSESADAPLSIKGLSRRLEADMPEIEDSVINALSLSGDLSGYSGNPVASAVIENLIETVSARLNAAGRGVLGLGVFFRNLLALTAMYSIILFARAALPDQFISAKETLSNSLLRFSGYSLTVLPGDAAAVPGEDIPVTAVTPSPYPPDIEIERLGESYTEKFSGASSTYTFTIRDVREKIRYRVSVPGRRSPWYVIEVKSPPRAAGITLTYHYPSYTGKDEFVTSGPEIESYRGTKVIIEAESSSALNSAAILTDEGEVPMSIVSTYTARGGITLNKQSFYSILLQDTSMLKNDNAPRYPVRVIPDTPPVVELLSPEGDIDVSPDSKVQLTGTARDDIGLAEIYITYHVDVGGAGRTQQIRTLTGQRRNFDFSYVWDISSAGVLPGSVITFRIAAEDNNTLYGPGTGYSRTLRLRVIGFREKHREILEDARSLEETILSMLEESYETTAALESGDLDDALELIESLQAASERLEEELGRLVERMEQDPHLEPFTLEEFRGLQRAAEMIRSRSVPGLSESASSGSPDAVEKSEELSSQLERMLSASDEALKREQMSDVLSSSSDSLEKARDLADMLRDADAAPEDILRQMDMLRAMLDEMMQALMSTPGNLPDEFINDESVKNLDLDSAGDLMNQLEQALAEGDFEKAAEIMDKMLSSLQSIMDSLQQAAGESQGSRMDTLASRSEELFNEMDEIIERQKEIIEKTEEVIRDSAPLRERYEEDRMRQMRRQYSQMKSTTGLFFPDADTEFSRGYLYDAPDILRRRLESLEDGWIKDELASFLEELEKSEPESSFLDSAMKGELSELSEAQKLLESELDVLMEGLMALSYQTALIDPAIAENLALAAGHMDAASELLEELSPTPALPEERRALSYLLQSQQDMQSLMEQLMSMPAGFQSVPMPGGGISGQLPGSRGFREGHVEIPGRGDSITGREFRSMILEALRQNHPEKYRRLIEEYFRSLGE